MIGRVKSFACILSAFSPLVLLSKPVFFLSSSVFSDVCIPAPAPNMMLFSSMYGSWSHSRQSFAYRCSNLKRFVYLPHVGGDAHCPLSLLPCDLSASLSDNVITFRISKIRMRMWFLYILCLLIITAVVNDGQTITVRVPGLFVCVPLSLKWFDVVSECFSSVYTFTCSRKGFSNICNSYL